MKHKKMCEVVTTLSILFALNACGGSGGGEGQRIEGRGAGAIPGLE